VADKALAAPQGPGYVRRLLTVRRDILEQAERLRQARARYDAIALLAERHPEIANGLVEPGNVKSTNPGTRLNWWSAQMERRARELGVLKGESNA
jgi:hypothetical protein